MSRPFKIAAERCATCIFGENSPVGPARMRDLHEAWGEHGHQICHQFGTGPMPDDENPEDMDGEDVCCRGFFETQIPKSQQELMLALAESGWDQIEIVQIKKAPSL